MNPGTGNGLEIYRTQQRPRHVRLSSDLDLDSAGGSGSSNSDRASHYTPLTTPIVIETTLQTGNGNSNVLFTCCWLCTIARKLALIIA